MRTFVEDSYYEQAEKTVTDKVVYLLGAGFSAPLDLPVMSEPESIIRRYLPMPEHPGSSLPIYSQADYNQVGKSNLQIEGVLNGTPSQL